MNNFPTQLTGFCGDAINIFNTLKPPTMTFSNQNRNTNGNVSQPRNSTPYSGNKFASTRAITVGNFHVDAFASGLVALTTPPPPPTPVPASSIELDSPSCCW